MLQQQKAGHHASIIPCTANVQPLLAVARRYCARCVYRWGRGGWVFRLLCMSRFQIDGIGD